jgi:hypothetical protein
VQGCPKKEVLNLEDLHRIPVSALVTAEMRNIDKVPRRRREPRVFSPLLHLEVDPELADPGAAARAVRILDAEEDRIFEHPTMGQYRVGVRVQRSSMCLDCSAGWGLMYLTVYLDCRTIAGWASHSDPSVAAPKCNCVFTL